MGKPNWKRVVLVVSVLFYWIFPDLLPGPIDDIAVSILAYIIDEKLLK